MTVTGLLETLRTTGIRDLNFTYALEEDWVPRGAQIRSADGTLHNLTIEQLRSREEFEEWNAQGRQPALERLRGALGRLGKSVDEVFLRIQVLFEAFQQPEHLLGRIEEITEYNYLTKLIVSCTWQGLAPEAVETTTGSERWDGQLLEDIHRLEPNSSVRDLSSSESTNIAVQKERWEEKLLRRRITECRTEKSFRDLAAGIEKFPRVLHSLPQTLLHLVEARHYRHLGSEQIAALGFERCYPHLSFGQLAWASYKEISTIREASFINDRNRFPARALVKIHPEMVRELSSERKEELISLLREENRCSLYKQETFSEDRPLIDTGIEGWAEGRAERRQRHERTRPAEEREERREEIESEKKELDRERLRLIPVLSLEEFLGARFPLGYLVYRDPKEISTLWSDPQLKEQLIQALQDRDTSDALRSRMIGALSWPQFVEAKFPPHYLVYLNPNLAQGLKGLDRVRLIRALKEDGVSHEVRARIIGRFTPAEFEAADFPESFILYISPRLIPSFGLGERFELLCRHIEESSSRDNAEEEVLKRVVFAGFSDQQLRYFNKGGFHDSWRLADYLANDRLNALEQICFSDSKRYRELTDQQMVDKVVPHKLKALHVIQRSAEVVIRLVNLWEQDPRRAKRGPLIVNLALVDRKERVQLEAILDKVSGESFEHLPLQIGEVGYFPDLSLNRFRWGKKVFATLPECAFQQICPRHITEREFTDEQLSWFGPEIVKLIPLDRIRQAVGWSQLWYITPEQAKRLSWPKWCVYKVFSWWKGFRGIR